MKQIIRVLVISVFMLISVTNAEIVLKKPVKKGKTSFAIFVDSKTYSNVGSAVDAYKTSIEEDGLPTYILADDWKSPDAIKDEIQKLYKTDNLEGVVFIGDIPIPMLRDAQHLTSAFKIDQESFTFYRTSAPSDRFYEDLGLKFKFLKQDTSKKSCFYYSLLPESRQVVQKNIYSGRIKAPVDGKEKYESIRRYLEKVVKIKKIQNKLDNMLVFTGHGYNSETLNGWSDENLALREQFPNLYNPGEGKLKKLNHSMSNDMKTILLSELQREELDLAMFHAHGEWDTQYIIEYPNNNMAQDQAENIKLFLRSKLRSAKRQKKSIEKTKDYFKEALNVPDSWFDGAFVDSVEKKDSILSASLDIYISDIKKNNPNVKMMIFDECFNGSFHRPDYMAGEYIFGNGNTLIGIANTTNALQDQWIADNLGILSYGVRVGTWHKMNPLLESHLFGDPTFHFTAINGALDLQNLMTNKSSDLSVWVKLQKSNEATLRSIALQRKFEILKSKMTDELVNILKNDKSYLVRLEAFKLLGSTKSKDFQEILKTTINDNYELIRRFSAALMSEIGREDYIPYLADRMLNDESERVSSNAKDALSRISPLKSLEVIKKKIAELPEAANKEKLTKNLVRSFEYDNKKLNEEMIPNLTCDTLKQKARLSEIRTFRGYNYKEAVPALISAVKNESMKSIYRAAIVEALGWYTLYFDNGKIEKVMDELIANKKNSQDIIDAATKVKNRYRDGLNNPLIQ